MKIKIIISPAKKMVVDNDWQGAQQLPCLLPQTKEILSYLRGLTSEELQKLWGCNEKLARMNEERIRQMDLEKNLTPALLAYEGIQYQYMAPQVFTGSQWEYVKEHLLILSGFYGVLRPLDAVVPYRLEMQAKAMVNGCRDLYDYWGNRICREVIRDTDLILNLASKEYSKCVERYLPKDIAMVNCVFGEWKDGKVIQKGTKAKMARGEMVRYLAETGGTGLDEVRKFSGLSYRCCEDLSDSDNIVFLDR